MKKQIIILIILVLSIESVSADSIPLPRKFKNQFQIGFSSMSFMDGYGLLASSKPSRQNINTVIPLRNIRDYLNFSYTRHLPKNYSIRLEYFNFNRSHYYLMRNQENIMESSKGDIIYRYSTMINLQFTKSIKVIKKNKVELYVNSFFSNNYRRNVEVIFLENYPGGFDFAARGFDAKSFGIGLGCEVGITLYKRFVISSSFHFSHYFDNSVYEERTPDSPRYYKYTPLKQTISLLPKIGYLF